MPLNWTSVSNYYGLQRPYRFEVAILLLLSIAGVTLVLALGIFLFFSDDLQFGTERFYFLSYVLFGFLIAGLLSRASAISIALLLWCATEIALGLSTSVLERYGAGSSLLPLDNFTQPRDLRFQYHPFLHIVPRPGWHQEVRFDERNEKAWSGWRMNWPQVAGRTFVYSHNSLGVRGTQLTKGDLAKNLIFVYGGSTTYDWGVTQGATWPERLQYVLGDTYTIVNFGVPAHTTTEHLIHTAFYQGIVGKKPVCTIYYVGWNDLINSHIKNLDPAYANYIALNMVVRKPEIWAAKYSPLVRFAYKKAVQRVDSIPLAQNVVKSVPGIDKQLEGFFIQHIDTISAINHHRGIKTIFIGQVFDSGFLSRSPDRHWVMSPQIRPEDVLLLHKNLHSALKKTAESRGDKYIESGIDRFSRDDFVDVVHFSATGSRKFGTLISKEVDRYCR